jgi:hypothetical protein
MPDVIIDIQRDISEQEINFLQVIVLQEVDTITRAAYQLIFDIGLGTYIWIVPIIPGMLLLLQNRATYYENVAGTTAILSSLENCES